MAIFPLKDIQSNDTLIRHTCKLYGLSLLKVLPLSLSVVVIYHLVRFGEIYFGQSQQLIMFIAILCLPLFSAMVVLILQVGEEKSLSLKSLFMPPLQRFLSLLACLVSMILVPLIVALVGVVGYFLMGHFFTKLPAEVFFLLKILIGLAVFFVLLPKIFAPILLFSESLEVNTALDTSEELVKMQYARTLIFTLYGLSLLWFIAILPTLFQFYFKKVALSSLVLELMAEGLLVLILPWVITLFVMQAKDLYLRKTQIDASKDQKKKPVEIRSTTNNKDNISF
jgi:hypothetical protein